MSHKRVRRGSESLASTDAETDKVNAHGDKDLLVGNSLSQQDPNNIGASNSPEAGASSQASNSTAGPDTSKGAVPKSRPQPDNDSTGTADHRAPSGSGGCVDIVPSFKVLSIKDGMVDLYGKDEKFHRKYLNNLKTLVTRAERTFGENLHDREVSERELDKFCDHILDLHKGLETIVESARHHGFNQIVPKGGIGKYFDILVNLHEECQLLIDGVDQFDILEGDEAQDLPGPSQESQVGVHEPHADFKSKSQIGSIGMGSLTSQQSGTKPQTSRVDNSQVGRQVAQPVFRPDNLVQPQTAQVQNQASVQQVNNQPDPQVAPAPVPQTVNQSVPPGTHLQPGRANLGLLNPVLDLIDIRNRQRDPTVPPRARFVNRDANLNPGPAQNLGGAGPPPRNPQNIPPAPGPAVPQPMGNPAPHGAQNPQRDYYFDPADYFRNEVGRLVQDHLNQVINNPYAALGQPDAQGGGNLGATFVRGASNSKHKRSSSKKKKSRRPSSSSSSPSSSDTTSSNSSNNSSSSESSDGSSSETDSNSSRAKRRRRRRRRHKRHSSGLRQAKLGQLPKFDGKQPELFRYFKSSYDYQVKQEKLTSMDKCVKLFDLLEGEARDLVVYYAEKFDKHSHKNMWRVLEERYGGSYRSRRRAFDFLDEMKPFKQFTHREQHDLLTKMRVVMDYIKKKQKRASKEKSFPTFITIRKLVPTKSMAEYINWIYANTRRDNIHSFFKWLQMKWKCTLELEEDKHPVSSRSLPKSIPNREPKPKQFLAYESESQSESRELQEESELTEYTVESDCSQSEVFWADNRKGFKPKYNRNKQNFSKKTFTGKPRVAKPSGNQEKVDRLSTPKCDFCGTERHSLTTCEKFKKAEVLTKIDHLKKRRLCWHCLRPGHFVAKCRINKGKACGIDGCQRQHHPLMHNPVNKSRNLYVEDILDESFCAENDEGDNDVVPDPEED